MFSLDVSWQWIFSFHCHLVNILNFSTEQPKLHCTHMLNWTQSVESYNLGVDPQRTLLATPLLLLRNITGYMLTQLLHSNGCTRHVSWHLLHCYVRLLPSKGCFSASTVLVSSKNNIMCTFFITMTNTMISQNTDLSSWATLYKWHIMRAVGNTGNTVQTERLIWSV
jgi:hypothetical protein